MNSSTTSIRPSNCQSHPLGPRGPCSVTGMTSGPDCSVTTDDSLGDFWVSPPPPQRSSSLIANHMQTQKKGVKNILQSLCSGCSVLSCSMIGGGHGPRAISSRCRCVPSSGRLPSFNSHPGQSLCGLRGELKSLQPILLRRDQPPFHSVSAQEDYCGLLK